MRQRKKSTAGNTNVLCTENTQPEQQKRHQPATRAIWTMENMLNMRPGGVHPLLSALSTLTKRVQIGKDSDKTKSSLEVN